MRFDWLGLPGVNRDRNVGVRVFAAGLELRRFFGGLGREGDLFGCGLVRLCVEQQGLVSVRLRVRDDLLDALARLLGCAWAPASAVGTTLGFGLGCTVCALFLLDQRLAVGNRDLVVVGVDFAEG